MSELTPDPRLFPFEVYVPVETHQKLGRLLDSIDDDGELAALVHLAVFELFRRGAYARSVGPRRDSGPKVS